MENKFDVTKLLSVAVTILGIAGTILSNVVHTNEQQALKSEIKDELLKELSKDK